MDLEQAYTAADFQENQTTEFKSSIFVNPETRVPGIRQMAVIAETLAAFMNASGGMLYVGVRDNGTICGIEEDLEILATQASQVSLHNPRANDKMHQYAGTPDKYQLKIRAIVKAFLSPHARDYIGNISFKAMERKPVCCITVKPCKADEYVYFYRYRNGLPEVAEIYVRSGNQKLKLEGEARDDFVRKRANAKFKTLIDTLNLPTMATTQETTALNAIVERLQAFATRLEAEPTLVGERIVVEGAIALDDKHFEELISPKGFVFDGVHVCDVKGWKGAYEALLLKLNELHPEKFDALPTMDFFKKYFIVPEARKRYSGYFTHYLGSEKNIRAKELSGKVYFTNPDYAVHRLLHHFNLSPSRIMLRG